MFMVNCQNISKWYVGPLICRLCPALKPWNSSRLATSLKSISTSVVVTKQLMHPYIINWKGIMDMFQLVTILLDPSVISTKQLAWLHKAVTFQGNFTIVLRVSSLVRFYKSRFWFFSENFLNQISEIFLNPEIFCCQPFKNEGN